MNLDLQFESPSPEDSVAAPAAEGIPGCGGKDDEDNEDMVAAALLV